MHWLITPPDVGRRTIKVWQRNRDAWFKFYKASLIGTLAEPILFLLAFGVGLSRFMTEVGGMPYINFIAPGLMAASVMNAASFECTFGSFTRMSAQKSYDAIMVTPVSVEEVAAGDILWGATKGVLSASVILVVLVVAGLVNSPWLVLGPALFLLSGIAFGAMGLTVTAFAPSYDYYAYYFSLAVSPMFFFSGIFFPLDGLPPWVAKASWFLPLTHSVNISRALSTGAVGLGIVWDTVWLASFTLIMGWVSVKLIRRRLVK
jgi:lipooligosaccharide transport system permease protein